MSITRLAVNNSRITLLGVIAIVLVGLQTYLNYPSAEDPTIKIREAQIVASYPGMSADRVENLITKPIETKMREIAEIDEIKSTSKTGETLVAVKLHDWVTDLGTVFQNIRNKANDLKAELPQGTAGPFVFDDKGLTAVATIALWADGFSMAEMREVARDLRDRLYTLDGIRRVELFGIQEERIYLDLSPTKLAEYGVSPQVVFSALAQQNIIEPGGEIKAGSRRIVLEPSGDFGSVDEIANVVFAIPNSDRVAKLSEIVDIRRDYVDPPETPAFFNDKQAIVLSVSTMEGVNNVEFGRRLRSLVDNVQQELIVGYVLEFATFQPKLIANAVGDAVSNVYQTLGIVLLVVMLFLGLRTGLIVGSFVPLTMLLGVVVMRLFDVELQRMSIAAMIIALGMLVDNGIVVAEDIRTRLERGIAKKQAAIDAGRALGIPLFTSSLTTIFAFVPMLLLDGAAGEYIKSLAQVVAILLLGSWVLSLTVTPVFCVWFMEVKPKEGQATEPTYEGVAYRIYRRILLFLLRFRIAFIVLLVVILFGVVQLFSTLKTEFFPVGERSQFLVYLDFEAGTDIRAVQDDIRVLTGWLADEAENPEIENHVAYIGNGGPRFFLALSPVDPDPHRVFILVNTKRAEDVTALLQRVNSFMDARLPAARSDAKKMWFGGTEPGVVEIRLIGPDGDALAKAAQEVEEAFHVVPGTVGIKQDWENRILKLIVDVDQVRAARAGVTSSDVAGALSTTFAGLEISDYREHDRAIPIVLIGEEDVRNSLAGLQRVQVLSSATDRFVDLGQVARVRGEWQFGRIKRVDQQRTITVQARNNTISSLALFTSVIPTLEGLSLPAGTRWEVGGEIKDQQEANGGLFGMLPLALAGIAILLIGQFNSFRKGGLILATIPLILIGGILGLFVMQAPFGFMVILGFFSLAGILINNGIVLIDRIQIEEKAGREPLDAVVTACLARLRPIVMTTLTTVLGLVPLILFGGPLFYGMACVIAFGLIVSTILTLGFVPAVYTLLYRIRPRPVTGDRKTLSPA
jgi:multidrug efflux pump subunit AcrB